ncbi:PAS-domain containing protein [Rhodobacter lacus]|uniref:PAS-domain containing protein n=1 Tax=Rhodobacter lacus TaxID=1641972 RepID=A0ABW5A5D5_9RHOB
MQMDVFQAIVIAVTSVGSAFLALVLITFLLARPGRAVASPAIYPVLEQTVFLFDDQDLVDATAPARTLLEAAPMGVSDWARLCAFAAPRFEGFVATMAKLADHGHVEMRARPEPGRAQGLKLLAEDVNGLARITFIDPEAEGKGLLVDGLSQRALEDELEELRQTLDRAPALVWREDETGVLTWANRAYVLRAEVFDAGEEAPVWPLPKLFDIDPPGQVTGPRRLRLEDTLTGEQSWFECHSYPLERGALHFALPADATIRAEKALRDFVQTLSKTFADLPIGLAVFDRQRQLQIFNPALIDLTQLGAEFLSRRPTLYAFLDRLREARMMPEPKDYRSWRLKMSELEQAAVAGFHSETWMLPSGQTYRVTGRPHPDGAVAFLFEDISAEISLSRRFRAELEQGQDVLDMMSEAVAVFQPSGEMTISNAGYERLWGVSSASSLGGQNIHEAVRHWQAQCEPNEIWARARAFFTRTASNVPFEAEVVRRIDGERIICRFAPMAGGAMLASFTPGNRALLAPRPLAEAEVELALS